MDPVSWENWLSDLDMDEDNFFNQCSNNHMDDEEFLKEILQEPTFSSESESHPSLPSSSTAIVDDDAATISSLFFDDTTFNRSSNLVKSSSSNSIVSQHASETPTSLSPTTYILSFDNSTVIPAMPEPDPKHDIALKPKTRKRNLENLNFEPRAKQGIKRARGSSETLDHIIAERKRRQELTERFIALSATIPGLKKLDKASILSEAINYVKQLQERERELEEQKNISVESVRLKKKPQVCAEEGTTTFGEIESDECNRPSEALPVVEARIIEKEVLIRIHCEKKKCVMLKILDELKSLHLSVFSNSVLPFGNSTLDITIIAQMGEEHSVRAKDVVKRLRIALLKSTDVQR